MLNRDGSLEQTDLFLERHLLGLGIGVDHDGHRGMSSIYLTICGCVT